MKSHDTFKANFDKPTGDRWIPVVLVIGHSFWVPETIQTLKRLQPWRLNPGRRSRNTTGFPSDTTRAEERVRASLFCVWFGLVWDLIDWLRESIVVVVPFSQLVTRGRDFVLCCVLLLVEEEELEAEMASVGRAMGRSFLSTTRSALRSCKANGAEAVGGSMKMGKSSPCSPSSSSAPSPPASSFCQTRRPALHFFRCDCMLNFFLAVSFHVLRLGFWRFI